MDRRWRIADRAEPAWRHWDGEFVFHHALNNDTHRLSEAAGLVLLHLLERGECAQAEMAEALQCPEGELDVILSALARIDLVAWR